MLDTLFETKSSISATEVSVMKCCGTWSDSLRAIKYARAINALVALPLECHFATITVQSECH